MSDTLFDKINYPADLRKLKRVQLKKFSEELEMNLLMLCQKQEVI